MSPRFIYFLQLVVMLTMVIASLIPPPFYTGRNLVIALGVITLERLHRPLCVGIIQRVPKG
jgi:hypothetical protein